jgi:NAD-dependent dihydropyrimidine dehydrogenase PreA subunit
VEEGYTARLAQLEAARCRACDHRSFEIVVDSETCKECGYCRESCGLGVFEFSDEFNKKGYRFMTAAHPERCVGCGMCFYACPDWSVSVSQQA